MKCDSPAKILKLLKTFFIKFGGVLSPGKHHVITRSANLANIFSVGRDLTDSYESQLPRL